VATQQKRLISIVVAIADDVIVVVDGISAVLSIGAMFKL